MAIRIRKISGKIVALCAAESESEDGDVFLDDNTDHALRMKFIKDYESEGISFKRGDGTMHKWKKYVAGVYDKVEYMVKTKDGEIYGPCWPNAGVFHPLDGSEIIEGENVEEVMGMWGT